MATDNTFLLKLLSSGDRNGYRILYDEYYSILCVVAFEYVKDKFIAETIVGDVILGLWNKRETLSEVVSLKPYLVKAVRNKSIDYIRSTDRVLKNAVDIGTFDCAATDNLFDSIIASELEIHLDQALLQLPAECRKVFSMSRFENLSYEEIAERLNISINTVKYHIKNAIKLLRSLLRDYLPSISLLLSISAMSLALIFILA